MEFKISFDEEVEMWEMHGIYEEFIGSHLVSIATFFNVAGWGSTTSESHLLAVLRKAGFNIIVEGDY
ncbi:hypothetical protein D3C78_1504410 [compost metagenome]